MQHGEDKMHEKTNTVRCPICGSLLLKNDKNFYSCEHFKWITISDEDEIVLLFSVNRINDGSHVWYLLPSYILDLLPYL